MANNTQTNSRRSPTPHQTSPPENTTPPSSPAHPPLEYDDPQRFRNYAHSISFYDDDFSTNDMFANPTPLPEHEVPSIIQRAEQRQQEAQTYSPARGTGLGRTDTRPLKRVRVDTPQRGKEESHGDAGKESLDDGAERAQKRVRFDVSSKGEESGGVEVVEEDSDGEDTDNQGASDKQTQRAESIGDDGDSSDDCDWSVDSGVRESEGDEKAQDLNASPDHDSNAVTELGQRRVETEDSSHRS